MAAQTEMIEYVKPIQDMMVKYTNALNEMMALSVDMAFDVMLKNFNFACMMRDTTNTVFEDALKGQQRFITEMVQVSQGYVAKMPEMIAPVIK